MAAMAHTAQRAAMALVAAMAHPQGRGMARAIHRSVVAAHGVVAMVAPVVVATEQVILRVLHPQSGVTAAATAARLA